VDVTVDKVAYSAFFLTQLDWVLRRAGIDTVAVCGIVTNGGVASTVRDAHMRDYRTLVLADGCAAFGEDRHQTSLADMRNVAEVSDCAAFVRMLA
jgi:ureidoacrylate peracid hydrolase